MVSEPTAIAAEVLRALAWLAPAGLPRSVVLHPAAVRSASRASAIVQATATDGACRETDGRDVAPPAAQTGEHEVEEVLALLAAAGLLVLTGSTVTLDQRVQAVIRHYDRASEFPADRPGPTAGQLLALGWLRRALPADPEEPTTWPTWVELLPHLQALFAHLPQELTNLDLAELLGETGVYLWARGRYWQAMQLEKRRLAIVKAALGEDHLDTATALDNLAVTLNEIGLHDEALPLQQRALSITEAALGPDHPDTALRLDNLASTLCGLDRNAEALPLRYRALSVVESQLGPYHRFTATALGNLARTFDDLGRHAEALPLQQRALSITEAALGPDHPDTARALDNLGSTLQELDRHADALPLHQRALRISEATLGPHHPLTHTIGDHLTDAHAATGQPTNPHADQER